MDAAFADRVVLITGAGSGIGRQLTLTLANQGAILAALDLKEDSLRTLADELRGKRLAWGVADVTDLPALRSAVERLQQQLGPVDILIANAGIGLETSALNFRGEDVAAQVRVNLIGVANSIDAVLAGMLERKRGHLVAISSLASYRGLPSMAGYCASKAGVNSLMDAVRVEVAPLGLHVTTICPGWIRTPLTANISVPQPHMLEVADAVERMIAAIRRKQVFAAFPPSAAWRVWLLRWLPLTWGDALVRWMLRRLTAQQPPPDNT